MMETVLDGLDAKALERLLRDLDIDAATICAAPSSAITRNRKPPTVDRHE